MKPCPGCGALVPDIVGPTHAYIGASPGCWAAYGEVMAKEFGVFRFPAVHRLTVDTYAVQHPGTPGPRSTASVAVHLIALKLVLEHGYSSPRALEAIRRAVPFKRTFPWLDPPTFEGALTVLDVLPYDDLEKHEGAVWAWARSVWDAWSPHHGTVSAWTRMTEGKGS